MFMRFENLSSKPKPVFGTAVIAPCAVPAATLPKRACMDCRHYRHIGYSGGKCTNQKFGVWDDISGWQDAYAGNVRREPTKCGPDALGWQNIVPSESYLHIAPLIVFAGLLALLAGWFLR